MKHDIRSMPLDEIRVVKAYRDLIPEASREDYELLYTDIKKNGLDPSRPVVVNEDMVLLDGHTRLEIAQKLQLEWIWVTVKEMPDRWAEREFVIKANLARRQLNTAQRAELGLKLLEIEQERARARQRAAGVQHKDNLKNNQEKKELKQEDIDAHRLVPNLDQADKIIMAEDQKIVPNSQQSNPAPNNETYGHNLDHAIYEQGRSLEVAAQQVGISKGTLHHAVVIQKAAQEDAEVAAQWEEAKAGTGSVNKAYQTATKKSRNKTPTKNYAFDLKPMVKPLAPPEPEPPKPEWSRELLVETILQMADRVGIAKASMEYVVENDPDALWYWQQIMEGGLIPKIGWRFILNRVERYEQAQIALLASEKPLPPETDAVGQWNLDRVHQATVQELAETFPEEMVHLIMTDAREATDEQIEALGKLAQRALVPGKALCVYITARNLVFTLDTFRQFGLEYCWTCSVSRPKDKNYHPEFTEVAVAEMWWMMLIFRKPGEYRQFATLEDCDEGEKWPFVPDKEAEFFGEDALTTRRLYVREMPRQAMRCFTLPGQLVMDPFTGNGVVGMVALEKKRRFLMFDQNPSNMNAINFRLKQELVWSRKDGKCRK